MKPLKDKISITIDSDLLEKLRESQLVAIESRGVVDESVGMAMLAGEHTSTARSTDGIGHKAVGKAHAFIPDTVDVRCVDVTLVVSTDGLIRVVIAHDVDDVHRLLGFCLLVGFARRERSNGCRSGEGVEQGGCEFSHNGIDLFFVVRMFVGCKYNKFI